MSEQTITKNNLGDNISYYEEDNNCYINIRKNNEEIDKVKAKIINAKDIREHILNDKFDEFIKYFPSDSYTTLQNDYNEYLNDKKLYTNDIEHLKESTNENCSTIKSCLELIKQLNIVSKNAHTAAKLIVESKMPELNQLIIDSAINAKQLRELTTQIKNITIESNCAYKDTLLALRHSLNNEELDEYIKNNSECIENMKSLQNKSKELLEQSKKVIEEIKSKAYDVQLTKLSNELNEAKSALDELNNKLENASSEDRMNIFIERNKARNIWKRKDTEYKRLLKLFK